jgi:hypothetical protein
VGHGITSKAIAFFEKCPDVKSLLSPLQQERPIRITLAKAEREWDSGFIRYPGTLDFE